jgi:hypothetical protein
VLLMDVVAAVLAGFLKKDLADGHQHKRGGRQRTDGKKNFA